MKSFSILLVALVATVGLCKGAALEKGDEPVAEEGKSVPPVNCQLTPSLYGEKKPEIVQEKSSDLCKGQPPLLCVRKTREVDVKETTVKAVPPVNCQLTPSLCGEKKPEVVQDKSVKQAAPPQSRCSGTASQCGKKKRELKSVELSPPLSTGACRSLCGQRG